jgi:methyl-accepting chemotaxis protein
MSTPSLAAETPANPEARAPAPPANSGMRGPRLRASLAVAAALTLFAALSSVILIGVAADELTRAVRERGQFLGHIMADSLAPVLWDLDLDKARATVEALGRDPDFVSATLTLADGEVVAERHATPLPAGGRISFQQDVVRVYEGRQHVLGTLSFSLSLERVAASVRRFGLFLLVTSVLLLAVMQVFVLNRLGTVFDPIQRITGVMRRLAAGETAVEVPHVERPDELGDMARAVKVFRDNGIEIVELRLMRERAV